MKKKLILIICLLLGICSIFIGTFAYYKIVVNGNINASIGNVVFNLKDSNNNELNNKTISLNNGNEIFPGDSGEFTITLDASGSSVDLYSTLIVDRGSLPTNLKFYTTSDHRSELHKYYSFLEKNKTNKETLTIYWYWNPYIDDIEDSKFINKSNLDATINVDVVQISDYAVMKNGSSSNLNGGTEFWDYKYRPYIRTIVFDNDLGNLPSVCTEDNLCFDITEDGSYEKVYGYLVDSGLKDNDDNVLYNLYIVSKGLIFAPSNCYSLFWEFKNLVSIDFNNNFNTSNVTNMGYMFYRCFPLKTLDLSSFNTSKTKIMYGMFDGCYNITELDLSNFNTSNVTNMEDMFGACNSLMTLNLKSFDTSNVINMWNMFYYCKSLKSLNLSNFNTFSVKKMENMFQGCSLLTSIDLSGFNTLNVNSMKEMFLGCTSLVSLNLSSFNTSNVKNMENMFYNCASLVNLNLSSFNTSNVINMNNMFYNCASLNSEITIMNSNITNYANIFTGSAINENSKIVVNYIAGSSTIVDNMILTKSSNSNVIKGKVF